VIQTKKQPQLQLIFDHMIRMRPVAWKRQGVDGKFRWKDSRLMKVARDNIGWNVRVAAPQLHVDREARFGVRAIFYLNKPADGDNLEKLLLDALTGVVWEDDVQVDEAWWAKRLDPEYDELATGVHLVIYRIEP
jgi:Holliday junction resolvase RusA-like endonuclease